MNPVQPCGDIAFFTPIDVAVVQVYIGVSQGKFPGAPFSTLSDKAL